MVQPKVSFHSVQGQRHTKNDDFCLVNQEQGIFIICDGVSEGGHGQLASHLVAKKIHDQLTEANHALRGGKKGLEGAAQLQFMQEALLDSFDQAQKNIETEAKNTPQLGHAFTTCITLWLNGRFAILAHIGDSRAYLYRSGNLYQITRDHSGRDELIKAGMAPELAAKNPMSHFLTRAFGVGGYASPDLL